MLEIIKRILVPVDFSAASSEALKTALNIAARHQAEIHVLHVYEDLLNTLSMKTLDLTMEQVDSVMQREAEENVARLTGAFEFPYGITSRILKGDADKEILAYIDANAIDLAVLATHGRSGLERFFVGSVTQKIVRYAGCPVLTFRSA